jgi:hypothetical protein
MSIRSTIVTRNAKLFDFRDPRPEMIDISDICESLAKLCRFTGHCQGFYSVAAHSVFVARIVEITLGRSDLRLEALLHESNEPYMNDINSPLKGECPDYKAIQTRVEKVVAERFNLRDDEETHKVIKQADWMAYCVEQLVLMPSEANMVDALAGRAPTVEWTGEYSWHYEFVFNHADIGDWREDRVEFAGEVASAMRGRASF